MFTNIMGKKIGEKVGLSDVGDNFVKDYVLSEKNAETLSMTLCKMRGAALKIGQALSMQEDHFVPPQIKEAFEKARQSANIMPEA
jgi:aarF domain-containing kinase